MVFYGPQGPELSHMPRSHKQGDSVGAMGWKDMTKKPKEGRLSRLLRALRRSSTGNRFPVGEDVLAQDGKVEPGAVRRNGPEASGR